jgi:hypothetical protein
MSQRALSECEQCGQIDDHPKVHIGVITKHHDCLSAAEEQMLRDSGPKASAIIDAAKKGARGAKLVELIESGKLPQAEGLHNQR